jgi:hypothetical protein
MAGPRESPHDDSDAVHSIEVRVARGGDASGARTELRGEDRAGASARQRQGGERSPLCVLWS